MKLLICSFKNHRGLTGLYVLMAGLFVPSLAMADDLSAGDTAWMITATVLVLFMTIPGLSLFYAGMVRSKNVLSVMMQCFAITCLMTILWVLYFRYPYCRFSWPASACHRSFYLTQNCSWKIRIRVSLWCQRHGAV